MEKLKIGKYEVERKTVQNLLILGLLIFVTLWTISPGFREVFKEKVFQYWREEAKVEPVKIETAGDPLTFKWQFLGMGFKEHPPKRAYRYTIVLIDGKPVDFSGEKIDGLYEIGSTWADCTIGTQYIEDMTMEKLLMALGQDSNYWKRYFKQVQIPAYKYEVSLNIPTDGLATGEHTIDVYWLYKDLYYESTFWEDCALGWAWAEKIFSEGSAEKAVAAETFPSRWSSSFYVEKGVEVPPIIAPPEVPPVIAPPVVEPEVPPVVEIECIPECEEGYECIKGLCNPIIGDGICTPNETPETSPDDCPYLPWVIWKNIGLIIFALIGAILAVYFYLTREV